MGGDRDVSGFNLTREMTSSVFVMTSSVFLTTDLCVAGCDVKQIMESHTHRMGATERCIVRGLWYICHTLTTDHCIVQVRCGDVRRSSASPRPPCDGTPSSTVCPSPRRTPGPPRPYPLDRTPSGHRPDRRQARILQIGLRLAIAQADATSVMPISFR